MSNMCNATKFIMMHCTPNYQPVQPINFSPIMVPHGESELCICGIDMKLFLVELSLPCNDNLHYCISKENDVYYITINMDPYLHTCEAAMTGKHCVYEYDDKQTVIKVSSAFPRGKDNHPNITKLLAKYSTSPMNYIIMAGSCKCIMKKETDAVLEILEKFCFNRTNAVTKEQKEHFKSALSDLLFDSFYSMWMQDHSGLDAKAERPRIIQLSKNWTAYPHNINRQLRQAAEMSGFNHVDIVSAFDIDLQIYFEPGAVAYSQPKGKKNYVMGDKQKPEYHFTETRTREMFGTRHKQTITIRPVVNNSDFKLGPAPPPKNKPKDSAKAEEEKPKTDAVNNTDDAASASQPTITMSAASASDEELEIMINVDIDEVD